MSGPLVRERHGAVLLLRLNRPEARNALTSELLAALGEAALEAESDPEIRVAVLTGTGDRAFCAGMDLKSFAAGDPTVGTGESLRGLERLLQGELAIPMVGAANGAAVAGGLELLLGCDVVVASSEASFGLPEVKRGLFPAGSGTSLGARVPLAVALEMTLTGDPISAARAHELGLVNAVVAPAEVLPTALAFASRIAANAPLGLAACKELVRLHVTDPTRVPERLAHWRSAVFQSEDAREGATAFVERRPPVWKGH